MWIGLFGITNYSGSLRSYLNMKSQHFKGLICGFSFFFVFSLASIGSLSVALVSFTRFCSRGFLFIHKLITFMDIKAMMFFSDAFVFNIFDVVHFDLVYLFISFIQCAVNYWKALNL